MQILQKLTSFLPALSLTPSFPTTTSITPVQPSSPFSVTAHWLPILTPYLSPPPVYLTLSTVAAPLVPRARLVTFNGFLNDSAVFTTATKKGSRKYRELTTVSDAIEAVFWFAERWTQVRVKGRGIPVGYYDDVEEEEVVEGEEAKDSKENNGSVKTKEGWGSEEGKRRAEVQKWLSGKMEWEKEVRGIWDRQHEEVVKKQYPETTEDEPVPREFAVVCILPEEVEIFAPGEGMRKRWKLAVEGGEGKWIET